MWGNNSTNATDPTGLDEVPERTMQFEGQEVVVRGPFLGSPITRTNYQQQGSVTSYDQYIEIRNSYGGRDRLSGTPLIPTYSVPPGRAGSVIIPFV